MNSGYTVATFFCLNSGLNAKIFFLQVNGNLVSPTHILANAEVVEIITYNVS